eukprot:TRINITY_DN1004_c0_g4_i2.p1 TRINITY_DN1004_c0_g4~~TRINITY_DN1004_c0_g4_i2.p1  ORF type:complete len:476 (-),score=66.76 TRINITY_DN1004_c0_g4_i2:44-1414(-)
MSGQHNYNSNNNNKNKNKSKHNNRGWKNEAKNDNRGERKGESRDNQESSSSSSSKQTQNTAIPGFILDPVTNKYFKIPSQNIQRNTPITPTPHKIQSLVAQIKAPVVQHTPQYTISIPKIHKLLKDRELGLKSPNRTRKLIVENRYNTSLQRSEAGAVGGCKCTYIHATQNETDSTKNLLCISGKQDGVDWIKVYKDISLANIPLSLCLSLHVINSLSSITCLWNNTIHKYTLLVSELGNMRLTGGFTVYNENLISMASFSLPKGSLWTSEFNKMGYKVISGGTKCVMFSDLIAQSFYRVHKQKSDVFSTRFLTDDISIFGSRDGTIKILDIRAKSCFASMDQGNSICDILQVSRNSNHIIASSLNGTINAWDLRLRKVVQSYHHQFNEYTHCKMILNDTNEFLFSGGQDNKIRIWNVFSGKLVSTISGFNNAIVNIAKLDDHFIVADNTFKCFHI